MHSWRDTDTDRVPCDSTMSWQGSYDGVTESLEPSCVLPACRGLTGQWVQSQYHQQFVLHKAPHYCYLSPPSPRTQHQVHSPYVSTSPCQTRTGWGLESEISAVRDLILSISVSARMWSCGLGPAQLSCPYNYTSHRASSSSGTITSTHHTEPPHPKELSQFSVTGKLGHF